MRSVAKWAARIVGGLAALVLVAAAVVYAESERRLGARFDLPTHGPLAIASDSATIARGRHIAGIRGCTECHGANLEGRVLLDDPMIGRLAPPNLTRGRGGRGALLTPVDWERAVRHGTRRDGTSLFVMPAADFATLSDEDMGALTAYARSVAPVDNEPPSSRLGPLGRALFVAGKLDAVPARLVDQRAAHTKSVAVGPTAAYGAYLAVTCTGCHTAQFTGGKAPGGPPDARPAANITADSTHGIGRWSESDFMHALRTGRRPDGSAIDSTAMPIPMTRQMSDTELQAIYRYLRTVRPQAVAAR